MALWLWALWRLKGKCLPWTAPSKMTEYTRKTGTKMWPRMGTSYPDPEQIPKMHLVGEDTRVWHAVFSVIELSISCLTCETCLESSVKTCLISHLSWAREGLSHRELPREEMDREAQAGSSAASAVPRNQSACHIPIIWCPCPSKRALEEKPINVRCCSGSDLVGKEHGILPLSGWPGFPRALGHVPVSSCSHWILFPRGMREIVCIPMLVGVVTEAMVRLPLFSWVLEKLTSQ